MSSGTLPPRPAEDFDVDLDPEQIRFFRENGYLAIERITTDAELEWLGRLYDELFAERRAVVPGGYFDLARPYDSDGQDLLPQVLNPEVGFPELRETSTFRNGRRLAATLLGVEESAVEGWGHMILKPPRIGSELPWHQDEAYWDPRFDYRALGVWTPLDPATPDSGCMEFLPGSHRSDVLAHRHIADDPAIHGLVTDPPDVTGAVPMPVPVGGATFHHCRLLHRSGPNVSARPRRAWSNEFQTPPVRRTRPIARRPWLDEAREAWLRRAL